MEGEKTSTDFKNYYVYKVTFKNKFFTIKELRINL